jgi:hypothetical protein
MINIVQDEQGTYRWAYELNLWRNPIIAFTVLKVILGIIVGLGLFMLILQIPDLVLGYSTADDLLFIPQFMGVMALLMTALTIIGYGIYAAMNGGTYCAMFEMDEMGITHRTFPKHVKQTEVIGLLNVLAGVATKSPTQVGIGLNSARESLTSNFYHVRSIRGSRRMRVIKVNEPLAKNQVYVEPQDYDFVFSYIRDHCPNAKVVKG